MPRTMISEGLKNAIRRSPHPQWWIARHAGLHPVTLSNLMVGSRDVELDDSRIAAIGALLGIPKDDCFAVTAGCKSDEAPERRDPGPKGKSRNKA